MIITHIIDDFLFELFPKARAAGKDIEILKQELEKFYSLGPYKPTISIKNNIIEIKIEEELIDKHEYKLHNVIKLCETGQLDQAKKGIENLIKEIPYISEYHRILGQIQSDQGEQDKAIDALIDALRFDPKNGWALIMMGNIFARDKDDISTAMKYYEQAAKVNPKDNIVLNNIGAVLMQLGKTKEALNYFQKALKLNPDYPNTYYALAMLAETEKNYKDVFNNALNALRKNKNKDDLFQNSMQTAINAAKQLMDNEMILAIIQAFAARLEVECGKKILVQEDDSIPTAAKFELAENYDRQNHIVKYKPEYPAVQHLVMHELVNLNFATRARSVGTNKLFVSNNQNKEQFIQSIKYFAKKLSKEDYSDEMIANYSNALFNGLNRQIYNTPIDLFIEDYLYEQFQELRPYQFLSLLALIQEGIQATTDQKIVSLTPSWVLSKSKIYNIANALHFQDLFGVNLIDEHKPNQDESRQAESLYEDFLKLREDKKPGQEYDLVQQWAGKLKLENYFSLINENDYRSAKSLKDNLGNIEKQPNDFNNRSSSRKENMETFMANHKDKEINMAVVMYMISALQYFKKLSDSEIKKIAFEIAMIGTKGISPDCKDYTVPSIKEKTFSGYHLLAYYYVSWALAVPEKLEMLQLPFEKEYQLAKQMESNNND